MLILIVLFGRPAGFFNSKSNFLLVLQLKIHQLKTIFRNKKTNILWNIYETWESCSSHQCCRSPHSPPHYIIFLILNVVQHKTVLSTGEIDIYVSHSVSRNQEETSVLPCSFLLFPWCLCHEYQQWIYRCNESDCLVIIELYICSFTWDMGCLLRTPHTEIQYHTRCDIKFQCWPYFQSAKAPFVFVKLLYSAKETKRVHGVEVGRLWS